MPITLDQVKEGLQDATIKSEVLKLIEPDVIPVLKTKGLVVRTADEEKTFIKNHETNVIPGLVSAQIGDKIKEVHDKYDADILEITGLKKEPTEKTYEFNKRVLKALKEEKEKATKGGDQVLKDQITELTGKLKGYEGYVAPDEVKKLKDGFEKEKITVNVTAALDKKQIAVPAHITDDKQKQAYAASQRNMLRSDFIGRFTAKQNGEGKTVYYEGDKLLTNTADASPMTEEQIIDANYSGYFVPAKAAGGAGSGAGGNGVVDPGEANLKTKEDVDKYLQDIKKLMPGGIDFNKERKRILAAYGITQ